MTYLYVHKSGETIERQYPSGKQPGRVRKNGRVFKLDLAATWRGGSTMKGGRPWPLECHALAVHPSQQKAAQEAAAKNGVETEYRSNGRQAVPIIKDRSHYRRFLKFRGAFNKESFCSRD